MHKGRFPKTFPELCCCTLLHGPGGIPRRLGISTGAFYSWVLFNLVKFRLWRCAKTRTPLCLATARSGAPTGWRWRALSAPSWPHPSLSSPTSPPRATRPCTGDRTGKSSSACHEALTLFKLVFSLVMSLEFWWSWSESQLEDRVVTGFVQLLSI